MVKRPPLYLVREFDVPDATTHSEDLPLETGTLHHAFCAPSSGAGNASTRVSLEVIDLSTEPFFTVALAYGWSNATKSHVIWNGIFPVDKTKRKLILRFVVLNQTGALIAFRGGAVIQP